MGAVRIWWLLINEDWPTFDDNLIAPDATKEISWVIALINEIRSTRSAANINVKSKVQVLMKNLIRSESATLKQTRNLSLDWETMNR